MKDSYPKGMELKWTLLLIAIVVTLFIGGEACRTECDISSWYPWDCSSCCRPTHAPSDAYRGKAICCGNITDGDECLRHCQRNGFNENVGESGQCDLVCLPSSCKTITITTHMPLTKLTKGPNTQTRTRQPLTNTASSTGIHDLHSTTLINNITFHTTTRNGNHGLPQTTTPSGNHASSQSSLSNGNKASPQTTMSNGNNTSPHTSMLNGNRASPQTTMSNGNNASLQTSMLNRNRASPQTTMSNGNRASPQTTMSNVNRSSPQTTMSNGNNASPNTTLSNENHRLPKTNANLQKDTGLQSCNYGDDTTILYWTIPVIAILAAVICVQCYIAYRLQKLTRRNGKVQDTSHLRSTMKNELEDV